MEMAVGEKLIPSHPVFEDVLVLVMVNALLYTNSNALSASSIPVYVTPDTVAVDPATAHPDAVPVEIIENLFPMTLTVLFVT